MTIQPCLHQLLQQAFKALVKCLLYQEWIPPLQHSLMSQGTPPPNSTWTRNGSPLASGMMYGTDSTGVLMISNVMLADSGNYTNTLHNMFNNQSFTNNHTISLQVLREWTKCQQTLFIIILILRLCQYATKSYCYKHHFKCCCLEVAKSY